jgi:adenosylmethionine-8-amino-7-oxononanoate aminotransferase
LVTEVRAIGLMAGIDLDAAAAPAATGDVGTEMVRRCRAHGLIVRRMFQGGLQLSPPLTIDDDEVAFLVDAIARAATDVVDGVS